MIKKLSTSLKKRGIRGTLRTARSYYVLPIIAIAGRTTQQLANRWWDSRHGVETSRLVDLDRLRIDAPNLAGMRYQPTSTRQFHKAIRSLAIQYDKFVFVDFGCGKGKCLFMASEYPFRKVIGVEFARELLDSGLKNLANYYSPRQKCSAIEFVECDAARYPLPNEPSVFYFYNPFGPDIMRQVRDRIRKSIETCPRRICVVYYNPVHRDVLTEGGWLQLVRESELWCAYMNCPPAEKITPDPMHRSIPQLSQTSL
jgi:predicted RNA methylase